MIVAFRGMTVSPETGCDGSLGGVSNGSEQPAAAAIAKAVTRRDVVMARIVTSSEAPVTSRLP
jgi:hypothetical protein